ncbi:hypothetical protein J6590_050930 [Homalodisca vitripennis]|nr:hypothetical protein J6590_050930 [Homalodisca vitripennis]
MEFPAAVRRAVISHKTSDNNGSVEYRPPGSSLAPEQGHDYLGVLLTCFISIVYHEHQIPTEALSIDLPAIAWRPNRAYRPPGNSLAPEQGHDYLGVLLTCFISIVYHEHQIPTEALSIDLPAIA